MKKEPKSTSSKGSRSSGVVLGSSAVAAELSRSRCSSRAAISSMVGTDSIQVQNRIFHHLFGDHVLQLKLIKRKHADHLHQSWGEDLALRDLKVQLCLTEIPCTNDEGEVSQS